MWSVPHLIMPQLEHIAVGVGHRRNQVAVRAEQRDLLKAVADAAGLRHALHIDEPAGDHSSTQQHRIVSNMCPVLAGMQLEGA